MNTFLNHPAVQAIGWALLHFIWQGTVLAAILALTNLITKSARIRYAGGCAVMFAMPVVFLATISRTDRPPVPVTLAAYAEPLFISSVPNPGIRHATAVASAVNAASRYDLSAIPGWIACLWLIGVAALSIFTGAGWLRIHQLTKRGTEPANPAWQEALQALKHRLKISKPVRLCTSAIAEVPTVIGWLRPYILLPVTAITGLDESQLRAILAHELAHIRRHDYLINLLQNAIETLLFYHPAVWWVSRRIRQERENCCDDLAVEVCGDVMLYAGALAQLEELRGTHTQPALAATGGDLLARIRRLTGQRDNPGTGRIAGSIAALITSVLIISTVIGVGHTPAIHAQSPAPHPALPRPQLAQLPSTPPPTPMPPVAPKLKFDVASIRPCSPTDAPADGGRGGHATGGSSSFESSPGRISVTCMTVAQLMNYAVDSPLNDSRPFDDGRRFRGGPAWINSDRYTIEAKTGDPQAQGATGRATKTDKILMTMFRSLLEDRFQLKIHTALEEVPAYNLTVAKDGLKLKPMEPGSCVTLTERPDTETAPDGTPWCRSGVGRDGPNWTIEATGQSLSRLAQTLGGPIMDRPVVDKTGVTALFTLNLSFAHDESAPGNFPPGLRSLFPPTDVPGSESVFTALEKLGLKLVPAKAPHGYTVIDHIERPTEN